MSLMVVENVHVVDCAEHGIEVSEGDCYVVGNTVEGCGDSTHDGIRITGTRNRIEGNRVDCTDARFGINDDGTLTHIGGNQVFGVPLTRRYDAGTSTIWTRASVWPLFHTGVLAVGAGAMRIPVTQRGRIIHVRAAVDTAPTGASVIIDVNKNGTTIFASGDRPEIAASTNQSANETPLAADEFITVGDWLTVDIDQVGSTVAGSNLVVAVLVEAHLQ